MNESIMRKLGFGVMADNVKAGKCPFCKEEIDKEKMPAADVREFEISGLCSKCQKEMFG